MGTTTNSTFRGARALCLAPALLWPVAAVQAAPTVLGTPVAQGVLGDANRDGVTNFGDFQVLERHFNRPGGLAQGDFDGNGLIDLGDFSLLTANLGKRQTPAYFGRIADSATTVPAGVGSFSVLNPPVIDKGGNVAFFGANATHLGIYRWNNGA